MEDFTSALQVNEPMSYTDYWKQENDPYGIASALGFGDAGEGLLGRISNFFTGKNDATRDKYNAYLAANERAYEQAKLNDARAYETWLSSTQYQRASKDMKAAGLNPYTLVSNGGLAGAAVRSSANSARSGSDLSGLYSKKSTGKGSNALAIAGQVAASALKLASVLAFIG